LRSFRTNSRENSSPATTGASCLASCQQDLSEIQALAS
jgi:hypothetical protein